MARGGVRRCGGESAFPWRGGGLRRPHFFLRRKKCGKESRLDLRSKGPLARCGLCKIGGADLAELVRRVSLSVQGSLVPLAPLPLTTARVGAGTLVVFGDYQIAPIAARSTAMGRWRLTPPGYGGTCLPAGRSVRGSDTPPACHSTPRPIKGNAWGCGGRSEKRLPWLKQAAASASAPVNAGTVLLPDNGDKRLCPREDAGNHSRP